jgi:hypothetical protein
MLERCDALLSRCGDWSERDAQRATILTSIAGLRAWTGPSTTQVDSRRRLLQIRDEIIGLSLADILHLKDLPAPPVAGASLESRLPPAPLAWRDHVDKLLEQPEWQLRLQFCLDRGVCPEFAQLLRRCEEMRAAASQPGGRCDTDAFFELRGQLVLKYQERRMGVQATAGSFTYLAYEIRQMALRALIYLHPEELLGPEDQSSASPRTGAAG